MEQQQQEEEFRRINPGILAAITGLQERRRIGETDRQRRERLYQQKQQQQQHHQQYHCLELSRAMGVERQDVQ
jgi:hypothetical protein